MRLTRKFIGALVIGVALVAMIQGFFDYRRERDAFDNQMRAEATALGRALARGMAEVWERDGEAAARQFLSTASSQSEHIRARWIWLDGGTRDAVINSARIQVEDLPEKVRNRQNVRAPALSGNDMPELLTLEEVERRHVLRVLEACNGNRTDAAKMLGLDRKTLYLKLLRWGATES